VSGWIDATLFRRRLRDAVRDHGSARQHPAVLGLTGGRTNRTRARLAGQAVLVSLFVISLFACSRGREGTLLA
jgi:hypothetical protein